MIRRLWRRPTTEQTIDWLFAAGLFLTVFFACLLPISDSDLWWHLKSGELIVTSHALPTTDALSFAPPTANMTAALRDSWLSQVLLYETYDFAGMTGVVFLRLALVIFMLRIAFRRMKKAAIGRGVQVAAASLAVLCVAPVLAMDNPLGASYLCAATLAWLMDRTRRGHGPQWQALPLMALWGNLSSSVVVGDLMVVAFAVGVVLMGSHAERKLARLAMWAMLCIVASMLNPNGPSGLLLYFNQAHGPFAASQLQMQGSWHAVMAGHGLVVILWASMAATALGMALTKRPYMPDVLVALTLGALALLTVRDMPFYAFAMAPVGAYYFSKGVLDRIKLAASPDALPIKGVVVVLFFCAYIGSWAVAIAHGSPLQSSVSPYYPAQIITFMERTKLEGRALVHRDWGGYFSWRLHPDSEVLVDSRDLNPKAVEAYKRMVAAAGPESLALLDLYGVDYVCLPVMNEEGQLQPLVKLLHDDPRWSAAFVDESGVLVVRNTGKLEPYAKRHAIWLKRYKQNLLSIYAKLKQSQAK